SVDQILMNLVVNARDAISSNGRVRISAEEVTVVAANQKHPDARDGHFVRLTVQDNGSGIDTTLLGRLFEPFFTTKPQGKGTGLGLSTVYGIAQQHEGWVEVTSKRGVGSSFHVYLPVSEKPAAQTKGDTSFATRSFTKAKNNRTVLVVEDEEVLREFISETLQEYGFDVLQAGDGHEAKLVWRTANKPIDLLFTDMVMPNGLSGARLASELIHESQQLKVLYTSGYSSEAVENAELLVEGRNFLPKPFNAPSLIDAVENCLRTKATAPLNPAAN
ncbi:MAG: ATP-binding protein, partial [Verrucomicrobiota bacterium]